MLLTCLKSYDTIGKDKTFQMVRTYTEQALHIVDRMQFIAKRDHTISRSRGLHFHESGYIYLDEERIGHGAAVQALTSLLEQEERQMEENANPPAPVKKTKIKGQMTWDSLNEGTKAYFFELAKEISLSTVQPKIGLKNAPRLSNLKRAGLIIKIEGEKKSQWSLEVTPAGKEVLHRA